jgi:hypothetical protein
VTSLNHPASPNYLLLIEGKYQYNLLTDNSQQKGSNTLSNTSPSISHHISANIKLFLLTQLLTLVTSIRRRTVAFGYSCPHGQGTSR